MSDVNLSLTGAQRVYVFLLRATGWMSLLTVPLFAFAWTANALRPDMAIAFVALMSLPGLLGAVFLAGLSERPPFAARPASFLTGLMASIVVGLINGLIAVQVVMMIASVQVDLLPDAIAQPLFQWILGRDPSLDVIAELSGKPIDHASQSEFLTGIALAALVSMVVGFPAYVASWMALFLRFKNTEPTRAQRERQAERVREAQIASEQKAAAMRAMRIRLARRQAG